jgi:hypothetical protein
MGRPVSFGDDFIGLFDWFTTRAFRLETLDQYAVGYEEEAMRRFLAGQPVDPGFVAAWLEQLAIATSAGRQMQRVHVVTEPLSDYLRYEMDGYRHSVAAGENVRILPRPWRMRWRYLSRTSGCSMTGQWLAWTTTSRAGSSAPSSSRSRMWLPNTAGGGTWPGRRRRPTPDM